MPEMTFRKIDASNYRDALNLKVHEHQIGFVAPNDRSLIQSAYEAPDRSTPNGIYDGDTMVGFILLATDEDNPTEILWVWRLMIGSEHQGKGYGRASMNKLIADTRAEGKYKILRLSYNPKNDVAKKLYASVGFVEEGIYEGSTEMVAAYDLSR